MKKHFDNLVNIILTALVSISLLGSLSKLTDEISHSSNFGILMIDILLMIIIIISILHNTQFIKHMVIVIFHHKRPILFALIFLILIWQVYLVYSLSGLSGWDPGIILLKSMGRKPWTGNLYFSYNPNTLFLLYFEHVLWKVTGAPDIVHFTYLLNFINVVVIDFSLFVLMKICKRWLRGFSFYTGVIVILLFAMLPWFCLPYSDCFAFAINSVLLLFLFNYNSNGFSIKDSISTGILLAIGYLIKPSIIITFMAFILIQLFCKNKKRSILYTVVVFLICLSCWNIVKANCKIVNVDSEKSLSMFHFSAMGSHGSGGYDINDVKRDINIRNKRNRTIVDVKITVNNYKKLGFFGTQRFLFNKQILNSADGTFGWGKEGNFLKPFNNKKTLSYKLFAKVDSLDFIISYSSLVALLTQFTWCFTLFTILWSLKDRNYTTQLLKYSIVGLFVFLLLFEGGRGRYLIQGLPMIFLLSANGLKNFLTDVIDEPIKTLI